jgi:formyl-CoA transferase/CoA:oxalate CoA-transferase
MFRLRTTAEWEGEFRRTRGLFGQVLEFSELFEHPQVTATGIVTELEHPTLGPLPQMRPPIDFSRTPGEPRFPPPLLGQHTAEVLESVGRGPQQLSTLVEDGVAIVADAVTADNPGGDK